MISERNGLMIMLLLTQSTRKIEKGVTTGLSFLRMHRHKVSQSETVLLSPTSTLLRER